jgi:ABC-type molybdenum transport system ATPase subunit/photorepair protein PhrA
MSSVFSCQLKIAEGTDCFSSFSGCFSTLGMRQACHALALAALMDLLSALSHPGLLESPFSDLSSPRQRQVLTTRVSSTRV